MMLLKTRSRSRKKATSKLKGLAALFGSLKRKKSIRRSKKSFAAKSVFKEWGKDSTKQYRRRYTDAQVMAKAREYQIERKRDMPAAQMAFNGILDGLGVLYESEAIFLNGDRWILADVAVRSAKIIFEIDGKQHDKSQADYDKGRDAWLLRVHGIRTVRFTNEMVYKRPHEVRAIVERELG